MLRSVSWFWPPSGLQSYHVLVLSRESWIHSLVVLASLRCSFSSSHEIPGCLQCIRSSQWSSFVSRGLLRINPLSEAYSDFTACTPPSSTVAVDVFAPMKVWASLDTIVLFLRSLPLSLFSRTIPWGSSSASAIGKWRAEVEHTLCCLVLVEMIIVSPNNFGHVFPEERFQSWKAGANDSQVQLNWPNGLD